MIKKILLAFLLVIPIRCYATTNVFSSNLMIEEDKIATEGYATISIKINANYKLTGISSKIEYDKSKLTIDEVEETSKFSITDNLDYDEKTSYISGLYSKGLDGEFILCSLRFKKTYSFIEGDTVTITLKDVKGNNDTKGISNSITITIPKETEPNEINNNIPTQPSDNNNSNNSNVTIEIDNKPVNNNKYVTNKDNVNISVKTSNGRVISGSGTIPLEPGENHHEIITEDEEGNQTTTDIDIIREETPTKDAITTSEEKRNNSLLIIIPIAIVIVILVLIALKKKQ